LLFAAKSGRFKLGVALGEHFLLAAGELRGRGRVTQCAVQANLVAMKDEVGDDAPRIFHGQRRAWANAVGFDRAMEALELAVRAPTRSVGRRIVERSSDMRHAADADELLEVLGRPGVPGAPTVDRCR
jgi:hypothetical protein